MQQLENRVGRIFPNNPDRIFTLSAEEFQTQGDTEHNETDDDRVAQGYMKFLKGLFDIPSVEAVAFLIDHQPQCPDTITAQVFLPMRPINENTNNAYGAVTHLDGNLGRETLQIIPGRLSFVDSTGVELHVAEQKQREKWQNDPHSKLLGIVHFKRE